MIKLIALLMMATLVPSVGYTDPAREFLDSILYTEVEVDDWLGGKAFPFGKYDPELGYLYRSLKFRHGVDNSTCTYTFDASDARRMINHADYLCRINTYGGSFTLCAQVSDGETWQEYLAAHLQEPVRNFGVGGYSVYQAYLRMKREEAKTPAKVIIFNIFDADHYRNLISWQSIHAGKSPRHISPTMPSIRANPSTGEYIERPNPCPTRDSVYRLCDPDWVDETFRDELMLKLVLAGNNIRTGTPEKSYDPIAKLASEHGLDVTLDTPERLQDTIDEIMNHAGMFASMKIIEKVEAFAAAHDRRVLYVLSYGHQRIERKMHEGMRIDQEFVDFLDREGLPYIDTMAAHIADYENFNTSTAEYFKRYYVWHYKPAGNFFQAFAIKDRLVDMLDPKPIPYSD